jgi:hypothetical protein
VTTRRALLLVVGLLLLAGGCDAAAPSVDAATDARGADLAASDGAPDRAAPDAEPASVRVLFIGNSYTFVNDLPGMVNKLSKAAGAGPTIVASALTGGGATLEDHWETTGAVSEIKKATWDVVVLQGQSVEPLYDPTSFGKHAQLLAGAVKQAGASLVLFETWARQAGHADYGYAWSGGDPKAMQAKLAAAYGSVAKALGGEVAPVGDAWEASLASHPKLPLFQADGSHPSWHGTYLAACVFYAVLAGRTPVGNGHRPPAVSQAEATALQQVADDTVKPGSP